MAKKKISAGGPLKKLQLKEKFLGGLAIFVSTVVIADIFILVMNMIGRTFFDPNWINITDPFLKGQMFSNIYSTGFFTGVSMSLAVLLFVTISFLEEKEFIKKVRTLQEAVLSGFVFGLVFFLGDNLMSRIMVPFGDGSTGGFGLSIQSALPYVEVFWVMTAFITVLPIVLYMFRNKK